MSSSIPLFFASTPSSSSSSAPAPDAGPSHILLELPTEILKLIDQCSEDKPLSLTIKGRPSDEAVLCTAQKTYAIRSVQISNELVLFAPTSTTTSTSDDFWAEGKGGEKKGLEMKDTLHELLELSECVPRVGRIDGVLRGQEWDGLEGREEKEEEEEEEDRPRKKTKYTLAHLKSIIQSSDAELVQALHEQNVLELNGRLLPLPPRALYPLLSLLLSLLVLHSELNPPLSVPTARLLPALKDNGVPGDLAEVVLARFGEFDCEKGRAGRSWTLGRGGDGGQEAVKEIGMGVLVGRLEPHDPVPLSSFLSLWTGLVPDVFQRLIALENLSGSYLLDYSSLTPFTTTTATLTPFPLSHLPLDPASRFATLFLTRTRWLLKDLKPFLRDLAGDEKGRERLVARFGRVVKERVPVATKGGERSVGGKKEKAGGAKGAGAEMVEVVYARNK